MNPVQSYPKRLATLSSCSGSQLDSPEEKDPDTDEEPSTNAFDLVDTKPLRVASSLTKISPDRRTTF
jgi:hypothetical protein